jgi:hypothetical protein
MNQQPDRLFRDKLATFQRAAPAGAWDKIEANLSKKNNKGVWLWVAASVSIVAIAGLGAWQMMSDGSDHHPHITGTIPTNAVPTVDSTFTASPLQENISQPVEIQKAMAEEKSASKRQRRATKETLKNPEPALLQESLPASSIAQEDNTDHKTMPDHDHIVVESTTAVATTSTAADNTHKTSMKIVITASTTEAYLDKKALAEATSDDKKSSTLKKLLKKAADLKTNQDPFGDLRQMKNEILALNFKNEKQQRGSNK